MLKTIASFLSLGCLSLATLVAAESYTGTYDWIDKKPDQYHGKKLDMTLTKEADGYRAEFEVSFGFNANKVRQVKYSGLLTGDPAKGLTGKVYEGNTKRYWTLNMKTDGTSASGTAKEPQSSRYKTTGTFVATVVK